MYIYLCMQICVHIYVYVCGGLCLELYFYDNSNTELLAPSVNDNGLFHCPCDINIFSLEEGLFDKHLFLVPN